MATDPTLTEDLTPIIKDVINLAAVIKPLFALSLRDTKHADPFNHAVQSAESFLSMNLEDQERYLTPSPPPLSPLSSDQGDDDDDDDDGGVVLHIHTEQPLWLTTPVAQAPTQVVSLLLDDFYRTDDDTTDPYLHSVQPAQQTTPVDQTLTDTLNRMHINLQNTNNDILEDLQQNGIIVLPFVSHRQSVEMVMRDHAIRSWHQSRARPYPAPRSSNCHREVTLFQEI